MTASSTNVLDFAAFDRIDARAAPAKGRIRAVRLARDGAVMAADRRSKEAATQASPELDSIGDSAEADAALLAQFAQGDQSAARALTERHLARVLAVATRMLRDSAEAEDVAQEAMLRMWRIAPEWRNEGARLSTWLHRVTLNLCHDRLRKRRGAPLEDAPEPEDPTPSAQAQMESAETGGDVRAALAQLPERQRAAIVLRHFEEYSNPEIAEALSVSVEAVESLLARGRRALKGILAADRPRD